MRFTDKICSCYNKDRKKLISVRDGVLRYYGHEIQDKVPEYKLDPNKIYNVYRKPETVKAIEKLLPGTPITDEHIDQSIAVPSDEVIGVIVTSEVIPLKNDQDESTIGIEHEADIDDEVKALIAMGKKQISLAYDADLRPFKDGFEQYNIRDIHHAAIIDCGRCGAACSFKDKKPKEIKTMATSFFKKKQALKPFRDEEGETPPENTETTITLEQVSEIANQLVRVLQHIPLDKLTEALPTFQSLIDAAGEIPKEETPPETTKEEPMTDEDGTPEEKKEEEKPLFADKAAFADAVNKAVTSQVTRHVSIIEKASKFLPDTYSFADKSPEKIMRDAIATQSNDKYSDDELPVAFKMLKHNNKYAEFADSASKGEFAKLSDKEL